MAHSILLATISVQCQIAGNARSIYHEVKSLLSLTYSLVIAQLYYLELHCTVAAQVVDMQSVAGGYYCSDMCLHKS